MANDEASPPFGAFAPNAAQQTVISFAHRSRLKRGAFRPALSRLLHLLRPGPVDIKYQGAAFRFYHQASATERGALFNPDYNLEELEFLRAHTPVWRRVRRYRRQCRDVCDGARASCRRRRQGHRGRTAPRHLREAGIQQRRIELSSCDSCARRCRRDGWRIDDRDRWRQSRGQPRRHRASSASAIAVPSLRLERILTDAGAKHVDALKIDVEGYEDRVLTGFFREAPQTLWPRAIVIEHLSRREWLDDCIADMLARGYIQSGKTRSNSMLLRP